jgi:hypothetical protein
MVQWLTTVISATQEAENGSLAGSSPAQQKVRLHLNKQGGDMVVHACHPSCTGGIKKEA